MTVPILLENANGVPAQSPGLRAGATPGTGPKTAFNRNAVAARLCVRCSAPGHNRVAVDFVGWI